MASVSSVHPSLPPLTPLAESGSAGSAGHEPPPVQAPRASRQDGVVISGEAHALLARDLDGERPAT